MERDEADPRLSQISTQWTLVFQAHRGGPAEMATAQEALMLRYAGAVHRYLLAATRDPEAAAELDQEFALRFLRGDLHRADPARGRFRDFIKRAVRNLMLNHLEKAGRRARAARPLEAAPEPAAPDPIADFDAQFLRSWRQELMSRAWAALEGLQRRTGQPYHTVLRRRVEHPDGSSADLAAVLSAELGRPLTAGAVRQALLRSREAFVGFLLDEVAGSLDHPTPEALERELIDLDLLEYCRPALRRRADGSKGAARPG